MIFPIGRTMSYKPLFSSDVINQAQVTNKKQNNAISLQQWVSGQINTKVLQYQPKGQSLGTPILSPQWNSDWAAMNLIMAETVVYGAWYAWKIPIGTMKPEWITKFQVEIISRNGTIGFEAQAAPALSKFIGWEMEDAFIGSEVKKISLVASIYTVGENTPSFETKLLVRYIAQSNRN